MLRCCRDLKWWGLPAARCPGGLLSDYVKHFFCFKVSLRLAWTVQESAGNIGTRRHQLQLPSLIHLARLSTLFWGDWIAPFIDWTTDDGKCNEWRIRSWAGQPGPKFSYSCCMCPRPQSSATTTANLHSVSNVEPEKPRSTSSFEKSEVAGHILISCSVPRLDHRARTANYSRSPACIQTR